MSNPMTRQPGCDNLPSLHSKKPVDGSMPLLRLECSAQPWGVAGQRDSRDTGPDGRTANRLLAAVHPGGSAAWVAGGRARVRIGPWLQQAAGCGLPAA